MRPGHVRGACTGGAALLAAWIAGCTSVPPATEPALDASRAFASRTWGDEGLQANLTALGAATSPTVTPELTARTVLAAALTFNPQLAIEGARLETARAVVRQAREHPNPTLSLTPERVIDAAMGASPWVLAAGLVWPLRTAGKRELAIEQALATEDSTLLAAASAVWDLRARARDSVCAAEIAQAHERNARDELALREDLVARLDKQAAAGIISRYEAARSRLERIAALERFNQAHAELSIARHGIAVIAAMPIEQIQSRTIGTACLDLGASGLTPDTAAMSDEAIGARLEVRAKLAEFRAVDAAWRMEIAKRTPDLALGPGYTYDQGDHKITFTISSDIPLSNRNDASVARAAAERDRVAAELDALQIDVLQAVARASDGLRDAEAAQASVRELVAEADELVARETLRRKSGETDEPTVIAARLVALGAHDEALKTARAVIDAIAALESATQTPLVEPVFGAAAALARFPARDTTE